MHLPETRSGRIRLFAGVAVAFGMYIAFKRLVPEFDLQQVLKDVSGTLGAWTYLVVGLFAFVETGAFVGLVVPGETVVVLGGAVAGQGEISVLLLIAIVWACAFAGDSVSYLIGHKLGRGFVLEHGHRMRISRERFAQVEAYFERHGGKTILIGRFIGLVRALAPFVAGSSGMRYSAMAPFSILGTGLWSAAFVLLGYFTSQNIQAVVDGAERGLFLFAMTVALIIGATVLFKRLQVEANRERLVAAMERRAGLRALVALGRRLAPQARFLRERLTPGRLGLEFTAPLAALAVGAYICVAYAVILDPDPSPTAADVTAADAVDSIRAGWLTSVAKVITALGSVSAVALVTTLAAVALVNRRRWVELAAVVGGVLIMLIGVPELKDAIARPRPAGGLVDAGGYAYPSGHAAYSVLYAWLAVTFAVRLRPGWWGATALIVGGVGLSALIGLSRVYLGVHYLSDVSGGLGFGVAAFSLVAAIAVLVSHIRQNPDREA